MKQVVLGSDGQVQVIETEPPGGGSARGVVDTTYSLISAGTERAALTSSAGVRGIAEKVSRDPRAAVTAASSVLRSGAGDLVRGVQQYVERQTPLGYSSAGRLRVPPDASDLAAGARVACVGAGFANHAEVASVPRRYLIPVPDGVSSEAAAFAAPAAIALEGIRTCGREPGETIAVIGLGLIGELAVRQLVALGYFVVGFDVSQPRVRRIGEVTTTVRIPLDGDQAALEVGDAGFARAFDGVLVCASTDDASVMATAALLAKNRATISVVGDVPVAVDRSVAYEKELEVRVSRSYGPGRHEDFYERDGIDIPERISRWSVGRHCELFLRLLDEDRLSVDGMIGARVPVDDAVDAYAMLRTETEGPPAIMLTYADDVATEPASTVAAAPKRTAAAPRRTGSGRVGVAVVGAQGYARSVHLPILTDRLSDLAEVRAIVSTTPRTAEATARRFDVSVATTDVAAVLADPAVDAVLIASSHGSHHDLVRAAAAHEKHVFVEKPFDIHGDRALELAAVVAEAGVVCRVGFNRRFAPAYTELPGASSGPVTVSIRANVPRAPSTGEHVSDPESSRIIGEAVHYFDLAGYCIGSARPVSVTALPCPGPGGVHSNLSALVEYHDGSVATVTYTASGDASRSKERVEVLAAGRLLVAQDFRRQEVGWSDRLRSAPGRVGADTRGRVGVLEDLLRSVREGGPSIGADEFDGAAATVIAEAAIASATTGQRVVIPKVG